MKTLAQNEYAMKYRCVNCGRIITAAILKGTPAPKVVEDTPCPNCGCSLLCVLPNIMCNGQTPSIEKPEGKFY